MKNFVEKQKFYNHPIDTVWHAISDAQEIGSWFIHADFKAEVGYNYTFTHEDTKIRGEVLESNPVYKLVYTWDVNNSGTATRVSWLLSEQDGGTLLTLRHDGAEKYGSQETAAQMFGHFEKGWEKATEDLLNYLASAANV